MIVYGLWHGGSSYAPSTRYERFSSLEDARSSFRDRLDNYGGSTPCVDDTSTMQLFRGPKRPRGEAYPDLILSVGPRGGVRCDRA